MNLNQPILECVPNFSEGKDSQLIQEIVRAIESVPQQHLLHVDSSPSANRTVVSFAGQPDAVVEAAYRGIKRAAELIDMRQQHGAHPRIGATDVCPLIPLSSMTMDEAIGYSLRLAQRVGEIGIPVYLYEYSSNQAHRKALPDIRKGQYEQLTSKMQQEGWIPDFGFDPYNTSETIAATGATVIGARALLVAFNISLNTKNLRMAKNLARNLRSASNGLPALRAIGWYMEQYECAQVSFNLLDYRITSPWQVWKACKRLAASFDVEPIGCEVIGLIPESCILEAAQQHAITKEKTIALGIEQLGLNRVRPFNPEEKILEQVLAKKGLSVQLKHQQL